MNTSTGGRRAGSEHRRTRLIPWLAAATCCAALAQGGCEGSATYEDDEGGVELRLGDRASTNAAGYESAPADVAGSE